jgi:flagellar biosynthesis protein FliQ
MKETRKTLENIIMPNSTTSRTSLIIGLVLATFMAATRSHHFATLTHLPDASWAVFFLAGFYLRPLWIFPALLALAGVSDYVAISQFGVSDFCVSPAYGFLVPAYGALWLAGRWYARRYRFHVATLLPLTVAVLAGAALAELLSSGGFYFFSGRFVETSFAEFGARLFQYFPQALEGLAIYAGAAAIAHALLGLASRFGAHRASGAH